MIKKFFEFLDIEEDEINIEYTFSDSVGIDDYFEVMGLRNIKLTDDEILKLKLYFGDASHTFNISKTIFEYNFTLSDFGKPKLRFYGRIRKVNYKDSEKFIIELNISSKQGIKGGSYKDYLLMVDSIKRMTEIFDKVKSTY